MMQFAAFDPKSGDSSMGTITRLPAIGPERPKPVRWKQASATLLSLCAFAWPAPAVADDPCLQPNANIQRLLNELNRASAGLREAGVFQVKKLGQEGVPPARFEVMHVVGGKSVFTARFQQRDEVSDHLFVGVLRGAPGTLEVAYGFGAGGAISCDYKVYKSGNRFVATKAR
jgi:hypothetical protein